MPLAATVAAPAPPCHVSPPRLPPSSHREPSSLNPNSHALRTAPGPAASAASSASTKVHLANLDRVLGKPPQPANPNHLRKSTANEVAHEQEAQNTRLGLLNALNLCSFVPFPGRSVVADEHMSPRSLTYLQQLLSADSPRASPKSTIASRWRRLHGAHGWKGLIDPLDADLRRELLRYGDFVQAAYQAFHSLPTATSRNRGLLLPDRTYRPTCSLFATSALSLPPWARRPNTPSWLTQRSSWVGYVAVCESDREIARMGRRDITIALRGTATCLEWAENLRASLVPLTQGDDTSNDAGECSTGESNGAAQIPKVARGFLSLYKTAGEQAPSLSKTVVDEVRRLLDKYKGEELSITVVGHSLGAALALLVADEVSSSIPDAPPIAVISYGSPKVGNRAFVERLEKGGKVNVLRIVNAGDMVTKVPGVAPRLLHFREGYEHAGTELRIDSRDSPCLRPDAGPACRHDLESYLHLIDGFTATGHPFRYDARRSVVRLLRMQRGNVKKVYVNRARELGVDPAAPVAEVDRNMAYGCVASPS